MWLKTLTFSRQSKSVQSLCKADPQVSKLIELIGELSLTLQDHYFEALVRHMIGQQLSVKVAATIWDRVKLLCGEIVPERLFQLSEEEYRKAGVSGRKTSYIKGFAERVLAKDIDLGKLPSLGDQQVIDTLVKIKGIGQWTAEMFLIFSLGRLNVLSLADAGLQRAYRWLYAQSNSELANVSGQWDPYNTVASLYLWEAVNEGYVDYYHSLDDLLEQENRH